MIRIASLIRPAISLALLAGLASRALAEDLPAKHRLTLVVKAGPHARRETPLRFDLPEAPLGPAVRKALDAGMIGLFVEDSSGLATPTVTQVERVVDASGPRVRATWILPREVVAGTEARFVIAAEQPVALSVPWSTATIEPGHMELKRGDRPVFRYNAAPVSSPRYGPIQHRDAYLHPAYSPSGALVTGDFSSSHPHHRGFFLAYERTKTGDLKPDFWNIHVGTGKIHSEGLTRSSTGPVTARFLARHRWEAIDKAAGTSVVVLRESWDIEVFDIPGSPYWLFDLTSTQQAVGRPLEVLPYRYGGMAYRGPEPFVKGTLDVLTSEGRHRRDGDQKPARWVDLTGPVSEGSDRYAGAMIADDPANPLAPTVVRIHPTTLPFFSYVPAYSATLTIAPDAPTTFRYRVLIHDGRPDPALDERVWRDFAEPASVVVE